MNEKLSRIVNDPKFPFIVGIVSFVVGAEIGYILGKRNRVVYRTTPLSAVPGIDKHFTKEELEDLDEIAREYNGDVIVRSNLVDKEDGIEITASTGFAGGGPSEGVVVAETTDVIPGTWDYEQEVANRTQEAPYILHKDEFYADELEYSQTTLTYYAGDDILVDEEDKPIYNHAHIVGELRFGHGSGDPNVLYVRNDHMKAEYEILFDPGLYSVEVLGLEMEHNDRAEDVKHATPRRFRQE